MIDPDLDDKIVITVIATGFEEKPRAAMQSYEKWRPSREVKPLKGSNRLLSKNVTNEGTYANAGDDNYLDVPTFMRNNGLNDSQEKTAL